LTRAPASRAGVAAVLLLLVAVLVTAATPPAPAGPRLRAVDGGPDYYSQFSNSLPAGPEFFPVGVWFQGVTSVENIEADRAAGVNTYVRITADTDRALIREHGMLVIRDRGTSAEGEETVGWLLEDEADMWAGPGWSRWSGDWSGQVCEPADSGCGFTAMQTLAGAAPDDGRLRYANYGKGVTFWESAADAAVFVNRFQDVTSADNYWFTDPNICGASEGGRLVGDGSQDLPAARCRSASNYGATVDRLRDLTRPRGSRPVWGFVELGQPFEVDAAPIAPAQISAAVWSSIIHGARGIIYFGHSFGGTCQTQAVLRDPCYRDVQAEVSRIGRELSSLAPVLNAPFVDGFAHSAGDVDIMTKWWNGRYYLFAGSRASSSRRVAIRLTCPGTTTATVLREGRTLPVVDGRLVDTFRDANAVHIYRIDGNARCAPS
jgi:hypothetical protein